MICQTKAIYESIIALAFPDSYPSRQATILHYYDNNFSRATERGLMVQLNSRGNLLRPLVSILSAHNIAQGYIPDETTWHHSPVRNDVIAFIILGWLNIEDSKHSCDRYKYCRLSKVQARAAPRKEIQPNFRS